MIAVDIGGKIADMSPMTGIDQLLAVARKYSQLKGEALSTVSTRAFHDGKKLTALECGEVDIGVLRLERGMRWFSSNWPDAPWPSDIPRPARSEVSEAAE